MTPISDTQRCPYCGQPPIHDVTREVRGVILSDLLCDSDHIWFVKFAAPATT